MATVPSNLVPSRITQLPEAPVADPAGYFPIVISGTTYKVQFNQINQNLTVPPSRAINAGTGLTGGGTVTTLAGTSASITNLSLGSLVISSTTLVANLNADLLDGESGSYYLDLANATGTLSGGAY